MGLKGKQGQESQWVGEERLRSPIPQRPKKGRVIGGCGPKWGPCQRRVNWVNWAKQHHCKRGIEKGEGPLRTHRWVQMLPQIVSEGPGCLQGETGASWEPVGREGGRASLSPPEMPGRGCHLQSLGGGEGRSHKIRSRNGQGRDGVGQCIALHLGSPVSFCIKTLFKTCEIWLL